MVIKILFIGDPHLKISNLELSTNFLAWVGSVVAEIKPQMVVNLGDSFDSHSVVRSEISNIFYNHVKDITNTCQYIYVLGNHDFYKPTDSKYHALLPFSDIAGLTIIDKPTIINNISFVPHIPNHHDFPLKTGKICVAHQSFIGADYGYYRPDVGVDADKVSAEIIISGHIHKRQTFGKVIYPGNPFSQGMNDINQDKGLMLFDSKTYDFSFIESPFPKWRGIKTEITQDTNIKEIHDQIVSQINSIDHWIIDITGPKAEVSSYVDSNMVGLLKKQSMISFRPIYNDRTKNNKIRIKKTLMSGIVGDYIDNVYNGSIDKDVVKNKAHEILTKLNIS